MIPEFYMNMLKEQYSDSDIKKIIDGYSKKRKTTIRVNTLLSNNSEVLDIFNKLNIEYDHVPFCDNAFIIKNRNETDLYELDLLKEGKIYMQSLSSMLPPIIMEPKEHEDILDMAAAPGGKTTEIAALTNNNSKITAVEFNKIRAEKLRYNIKKQGCSKVFVLEADSKKLDDFFKFDNILLDAPCSGSGTLDLNNDRTFKYFTEKLIKKSSETQFELLKKALTILKPGKTMIYSTCSILSIENEDVVSKVMKQFNCEIVPINVEGVELLPTKIEGTMVVCPNELYEGFYIAKIKKKEV
ncbi:MAG: RsmB/NOP family class I SAM-dependent RNA methyltransferase [Bacilli bacterium]|nr:RsmB/NOP family class I SAM-dependent RNA methyltransferase [Bacilli bacterium]